MEADIVFGYHDILGAYFSTNFNVY